MTVKSSGALLLPDVHLMLRGSSGRVRELGRGDRDAGYAWSYVNVGGETSDKRADKAVGELGARGLAGSLGNGERDPIMYQTTV